MASFPIFALTQNNPDLDAAAPLVGLFFFIYFALIILVIVSMWNIIAKAGNPGWAAIIPIFQFIVLIAILVQQTIAKNNLRDGKRKSFGKVIFWEITCQALRFKTMLKS